MTEEQQRSKAISYHDCIRFDVGPPLFRRLYRHCQDLVGTPDISLREELRSIPRSPDPGHHSALIAAPPRAGSVLSAPGPCGPTFGPNSRPGRPPIIFATNRGYSCP